MIRHKSAKLLLGITVAAVTSTIPLSLCGLTVRNTLQAYRADPANCLRARSPRPKHATPLLDEAHCERLRAILHESPCAFGKHTSLWTLARLAEVCFEQGLTPGTISVESVRRALQRVEVGWKRAKHWITSPDPR